jgi:transcriptional regulator with XRE-family HTH domain
MLGLQQKETAARLGVTVDSVRNWEKGRAQPLIQSIAAILEFLDYDPFPEPTSIPGRLRAKRRAMGWSIRQAAAKLGVDPGTWGDWERGKVVLFRAHRRLVAQLLGLQEGNVKQTMAARWTSSHK